MRNISKYIVFILLAVTFVSCKKTDNSVPPTPVETFEEALDVLFKSNKNLYAEGKFPSPNFFIDLTNRKLIYKDENEEISVKFNNGSSHDVKRCEQSSANKQNFEKIISKFTLLEEKDKTVEDICDKIGAISVYNTAITNASLANKNDIILSLIYNTVIGDENGHVAVELKDGRLSIYTKEDYPTYWIDTDKIIALANYANGVIDKPNFKPKDVFANIDRPNFVYHDNRHDKIVKRDGAVKQNTLPDYLNTLQANPKKIYAEVPGVVNQISEVSFEAPGIPVKNLNVSEFKKVIEPLCSSTETEIASDAVAEGGDEKHSTTPTWVSFLVGGVCILLGSLLGAVIGALFIGPWLGKKAKSRKSKAVEVEESTADEQQSTGKTETPKKEGLISLDLSATNKISDILKAVVKKLDSTYSNDYSELIEKKKESENVIKKLQNVAEEPSIHAVLSAFQENFTTSGKNLVEEFNELNDIKKKNGQIVDKFRKLSDGLSIESLLKTYEENFPAEGEDKDKLQKEYSGLVSKNKENEKTLDNLKKVSENISIPAILKVYEDTFVPGSSEMQNLYNSLEKRLHDAPEDAKTYQRIIDTKTEEELLILLDEIRKKEKSLPKVQSLSSAYRECQAEVENEKKSLSANQKFGKFSQDTKMIRKILSRVGSSVGDVELSKSFESYVSTHNNYINCGKLLKSPSSNALEDFKKLINDFAASEQSIDDAVEFATKFQSTEEAKIKTKDEILKTYNKIVDSINDFETAAKDLLSKDKLGFWDRIALSIWSVSKGMLPILQAVGKDGTLTALEPKAVNDLKDDLIMSYAARYFLAYSVESSMMPEAFAKGFDAQLNDAIVKYNASIDPKDTKAKIDGINQSLEERFGVLKDDFRRIRGYDKSEVFIDKMWDTFVKDFAENKNKSTDKSYILGKALTIAFYTADFLEHVKGRDLMFCYNYKYLYNNFSAQAAGLSDFVFNDIHKSTMYANFIYSLAEELGINNLDVVIDNFLIKPSN